MSFEPSTLSLNSGLDTTPEAIACMMRYYGFILATASLMAVFNKSVELRTLLFGCLSKMVRRIQVLSDQNSFDQNISTLSTIQFCTRCEVCPGASFRWNMYGIPAATSTTHGLTTFIKMSR